MPPLRKRVLFEKKVAIEEIKLQQKELLSEKVKYSVCFKTTNLFMMKLVQMSNKIERHICGIMTLFLSSMHSSYYIYLLYVNLKPTIFDS